LREILERCKRRFGVTSNCFEGGFILPDGSLLDFSGKTGYESDDPRDWGRVVRPDLAGFHNVDHREIDLCVESVPGSDPVYIFQCQGGATRFFKSSDGDLNVSFDVCRSPSEEQWETIRRCCSDRIFFDVYSGRSLLVSGSVEGCDVDRVRSVFEAVRGG